MAEGALGGAPRAGRAVPRLVASDGHDPVPELQRIEAENLLLLRQLTDARAQVAQRDAELMRQREYFAQSRSWRYTQPLRSLKKLVLPGPIGFRTRRRVECALQPARDVDTVSGTYKYCATGDDPQFLLVPSRKVQFSGWFHISFSTEEESRGIIAPRLYIDVGNGFDERLARPLPHPSDGVVEATLQMPEGVVAVRLDPGHRPGRFNISRVRFQYLTTVEVLARHALSRLLAIPDRKQAALKMARAALRLLKPGGMAAISETIERKQLVAEYAQWVAQFDTHTDADRSLIAARIERMPSQPTFCVVMPVYNVGEHWLRRAIESVQAQYYPHWELCIADDASTEPHVARVLQDYAKQDPRIKVAYRKTNGHISAASNSALALATAEYIALLDHDDELAPHALYMMAEEIIAHPDAGLLYSDEDKLDRSAARCEPYFKPDWNPDLFLAQNMVSHLGVYRRTLVEDAGRFREGFEGSQDYDLALRISERLAPQQIRHVPHVLYHWRCIAGSTAASAQAKEYALNAARKAVQSHLARTKQSADIQRVGDQVYQRVRYTLPAVEPLVSLVIPTRDRVGLLRQCIESIRRKTDYKSYEIIVVDNQSSEQATMDYLAKFAREQRVRVIPYDGPFNFSAINNHAVENARGQLVAFVNNDIEVVSPDWLREMVAHAVRPDIGAVGAMLYYPDNRVQHAGVVLGMGGIAGHIYKRMLRGESGYASRASLHQNYSAVTAACLVVRRSVFQQVGGFDEKLAVAFNDVDLCLRIRACGYRNLWTPYAELYHHESASRGDDMAADKRDRFAREIAYMEERWGDQLRCDPAYNPNLSLESEDCVLAFPPRARKPWLEPIA